MYVTIAFQGDKIYVTITFQGDTKYIRHYHISGNIKHTSLSHLGRHTKRTRLSHYRRHKIFVAITLQGDKYNVRDCYNARIHCWSVCYQHLTVCIQIMSR